MRRLLANLFAAGCFVLFVLSASMWWRSQATADELLHQNAAARRGVISSRGGIAAYSYDRTGFTSDEPDGWTIRSGKAIELTDHGQVESNHHRSFLGFWFFRDSKVPGALGSTLPGWCLIIPYWFLTLLFCLVPLGRLLRMKRAKR